MAVSVEKALELIYATISAKRTKIIPLEEALGAILAEEVVAIHNLPPYDNSAMDGYAVKLEDSQKSVVVKATIFAGDAVHHLLACGEAIKIMTGARLPEGTEAIVPIEDVVEDNGSVILPAKIERNKHIRYCGEDITKGEILLCVGTKLNAHQITLLASQGKSHVKVYEKPRVALFASGSELKMHFEQVASHQLYNTNTPTFLARARELGCEVSFIGTANDTLEDIKKHIEASLEYDLIITSGGVSVGDADFTKEAFSAYDFEPLFDKVEIKPGKPTTFGKVQKSYVLNLPGNPLAAALNFELFAKASILALSGTSAKFQNSISVKLAQDFRTKAGKRSLIPGFFDGESFRVCEKFAPGMVRPLSLSNGFIMLDETAEFLACGAIVKFIPTTFDLFCIQQKSLITLQEGL